MNKNITTDKIQKLVGVIRREIEQGKANVEKFVNYQLVMTNWNIGRHIDEYLILGKARGQWGQKVIKQLSDQLGIKTRNLNLTVQFYRMYPKLPKPNGLNWSHYRTLIAIPDLKKRLEWEKSIVRNQLSAYQLIEAISQQRNQKVENTVQRSRKLIYNHGRLYTYRLIYANRANQSGQTIEVDCGFRDYVGPQFWTTKIKALKAGTIIESEKSLQGYSIHQVRYSAEKMYTYVASVDRVIDGDTLDVNIEVGFSIGRQERLRLRGIDAPERNTVAGKAAKAYVESVVAKLPFIIIKTYGSGKYGRYITDVFYMNGETDPHRVAAEGIYLNQELLDKGLAIVWTG